MRDSVQPDLIRNSPPESMNPILARMSPEDRNNYQRLRAEGYAALKEAHAIFMREASRA